MKQVIFIILIITFGISSFAQQLPEKTIATPDFYLAKANKQKRTGRYLLYSGTGLIVAGGGLFIAANTVFNRDNIKSTDALIAAALCGASGTLLTLTSIPFFASAKKNQKKAETVNASVIFKPEYNSLSKYSGSVKNYPAIGFQINF